MANPKSSASAHPPSGATREQRGLELARLRGDEIWRCGPHVWRVPSSSSEAVYLVDLKHEACPCEDRRLGLLGRTCKHLFAARVIRAKSAECASCGSWQRTREMVEVGPETANEDAAEGERFCQRCAPAHGVL